ncbi:hypothetical protein Salat_2436000 [Sesamum alatum]|uniref:RNase H type-1 domain-containing protein n=1 Tax=Sesamum alatum TaxID=300844 RepID=A0AAE2CFJ8_9LAMI|nr:hypothetical protein Salat_2436000 [Sesamum alatum]
MGVVARNSNTIQTSRSKLFLFLSSPEQAKILAMKDGIEQAIQCSWNYVIIESDCCQKVNSTSTDKSLLGNLVHDTRLLSGVFVSCKFTFVRRSSNCEAHTIAIPALEI